MTSIGSGKIVVLLLGVGLLFWPASGIRAQSGDIEPNDSPGQAITIQLPFFTILGQISNPQDVDYFKFAGQAGKDLIVWVSINESQSDLLPAVALYDASARLVAYNTQEWNLAEGRRSRDAILYIKLPKTGNYFVMVASKARFLPDDEEPEGTEGSYSLNLIPYFDGDYIGDANEPNDTRAEATEISIPHESFGTNLLYFGDVDWYRFVAHRGTPLTIDIDAREMSSQPGWDMIADVAVGLFDAGGRLLQSAAPAADPDTGFPQDPAMEFFAPYDGVYYLAVTSSVDTGFGQAFSSPAFVADPVVSSAAHRIGWYSLKIRNVHRLLFPQIATGSFGSVYFATSILLLNPTAETASGRVDFFAPDGSPLQVALKSSAESATSYWFHIPPKGSTVLTTDGGGPGSTGYAKVVATGPVGGSAVFAEYAENGDLLTEAAVGSAEPMDFFVFPVDVSPGYNTGIAVANPRSDGAASLYFKLLNTAGETLATRSLTLGPGHQIATFVSGPGQLFPDVSNFRGSLQVLSDTPLPAVALRSTSRTLTTLPAAPMNQTYQPATFYFPHIVVGNSWSRYQTSILITNPGYFPVSGTIRFVRSDGAPMPIRIGTGTTDRYEFRIGAQGSFFLESSPDQDYQTGYAVIQSEHAVGAAVIFSQFDADSGMLLTEVGIPAASLNRHFLLFVEFQQGYNTGIAVANIHPAPAQLQLSLHPDASGGPDWTEPLSIQPEGHSAALISGTGQLFPAFEGAGTLEVISSQVIPAVALRVTARTLTALPVVPLP